MVISPQGVGHVNLAPKSLFSIKLLVLYAIKLNMTHLSQAISNGASDFNVSMHGLAMVVRDYNVLRLNGKVRIEWAPDADGP